MSWYKQRILDLIGPYRTKDPYVHWNAALFETIAINNIPVNILPPIQNVGCGMGILERTFRTAQLWCDDKTLGVVREAHLLSIMYLCLAYPRDTCIIRLAEVLPEKSPEASLCLALADKDSDYRHLRNAIAHGTLLISWKPSLCGIFDDRKWHKKILYEEILLLCFVVLDILMSVWSFTDRNRL
ncbi:MAG: hypothetical protein JXB10_03720 [Pirellulales bacterium]|nr:hypothetical protein [Pirellulales bacterium]